MEWLSENAWAAWLGLAAFLGVAELVSLDLVFAMLAVGALAGLLTSLAVDSVVLAALVAGLASFAMLALVRPSVLHRLHSGPELRVGPQTLLGLQAVLPTPISAHQPGRVKLDGEDWSARPYDESLTIPAGTLVEVFEIRGVTALVHPVASLEP
jgi:membrane protein implicated in regulation of membrane protease activity